MCGCRVLFALQVKEDLEWPRLSQVPSLLDPWNEIRDKFNTYTDEFKVGAAGPW